MTRKPKTHAKSVLIRAKIPAASLSAIESLSKRDGVTVPTYLRSIVDAYLHEPIPLTHRPAQVGLAAASDETRRAVSSKGGQAKRDAWTCSCGRKYAVGGSAVKAGSSHTCDCGATRDVASKGERAKKAKGAKRNG